MQNIQSFLGLSEFAFSLPCGRPLMGGVSGLFSLLGGT